MVLILRQFSALVKPHRKQSPPPCIYEDLATHQHHAQTPSHSSNDKFKLIILLAHEVDLSFLAHTMPSEHRIIYRRRLMALQYQPPRCSPRGRGARARHCSGDFQLCGQACGLPALRHPRGQRADAARAYVLRIPRVRHDHCRQRYGAHCLRLAQGTTRRRRPG